MNDDLKDIERRSIQEHINELAVSNWKEKLERWPVFETVDFEGERFELAGNWLNRLKIRIRVAVYNLREKVDSEILNMLLTKLILHLDRNAEKWLRRVAKGDTFLGKVIFGFLDVAAIPNFHEILKAVNKQTPDATASEKAKLIVQKVDWTRTLTGVVVAVAIAMGWISPEILAELF